MLTRTTAAMWSGIVLMTNDLVPGADAPANDPSLLAADAAAAPAASTEPTSDAGSDAAPADAEASAPDAPDAVDAEPAEPAEPAKPTFASFGLESDIQLALDEMGYLNPTPVQTAVFGPVREGKDLLVQSRTGTGKTAAFGLPIIQSIIPAIKDVQALILAPTRELAIQVSREITAIGKHKGVVVEPIYGGAPIGKQINALREGVHIVVGTPGRVLDHIGRRTLSLKQVRVFVLDECDEMLSMGFLE